MSSGLALAAFDTLRISDAMERHAQGATATDLHIFSYLACLLSLFEGHPAAAWGYSFVSTDLGSPFSSQVAEAMDVLVRSGRLRRESGRMTLTQGARASIREWSSLRSNQRRRRFIDVACDSVLTLPPPVVAEGVREEPGLKTAMALSSERPLLDDLGLSGLHEHFAALRRALPQWSELFVPATVWLSYLATESGVLPRIPN